MAIFKTLFYQPLFNILIFISSIVPGHDLGLAIVILTVFIRLIFMPLSLKSLKSQRAMSALAPKVKEIQEKFKTDRAKQNAAVMELYKENRINPLAGCLPLIIQAPILIALYQVFVSGVSADNLGLLYSFVPRPENLNVEFLGLFLVTSKNIYLVLLAGILQFFQAKQSMSLTKSATGQAKEMAAFNKQMLYFMPIFVIIVGWNFQAGLILSWIANTLFSILEQIYVKRNIK